MDAAPDVDRLPAAERRLPRASSVDLARGAVAATLIWIPVGVLVFTVLGERGLVVGNAWLTTLLIALIALLTTDPVQRRIGGGRLDNRPLTRLLITFSLLAAVNWTAGWSMGVAAAAPLASVAIIQRTEPRTWRTAALVVGGFTVLGELGVQAGVIPTVASPGVSHLGSAGLLVYALVSLLVISRMAREQEEATLALALAEARLRALMDSSTDVLAVVDADGTLTYVSPAARGTLGASAETFVGRRVLDLVDGDHRPEVEEQLRWVMRKGHGTRASFDVLVVLSTRERRWFEWSLHNLLDDPLVRGLVIDQRDITDRRRHSDALAHAAAHDELTRLPNRRELMRLLSGALAGAGPGSAVAVLFLDLDGFKAVNDTYGHAIGDELLVVTAQRLAAALRSHDHLARLGGDEFCAVLTEVADPAEVHHVAERLAAAVAQPVRLGDLRLEVSVSIGSTVTTDPAADTAALFTAADAAMYEVKRRRAPARDGRARSAPAAGPDPAVR